jgi:hypothetical protein
MFIIVNGTEVLLGPMPWKKRRFEQCLLEDLEIEYTLPLSNSNAVSIIENVKILPLTSIDYPIINQKIQTYNGPYYNIFEDHAESYYVPTDQNIDVVKSSLKEKVAYNRWAYETEGITVTVQNAEIFVSTQRGERDIFLQALQLGKNNATWKFDNDIWLVLTLEDLNTIVTAVMTHVQIAFDWESQKINEINSATTLQQLDLIEILPNAN